MARFANEILEALNSVTRELELKLGPGTRDLNLRVGIHSGAVTAGVLRGEKSRFQLFGDAVNTAARMESNGMPGRIHCSQSTATYLINGGKSDWLAERDEMIEVKGKGNMQTFWVEPKSKRSSAYSSDGTEQNLRDSLDDVDFSDTIRAHFVFTDDKTKRLVDWCFSTFHQELQSLLAHRGMQYSFFMEFSQSQVGGNDWDKALKDSAALKTPRDEIVQSIDFAAFLCRKSSISKLNEDPGSMQVPEHVAEELRLYLSVIAGRYRSNAYHNFEHACHVVMTSKKMLRQCYISEESPVSQRQESAIRRNEPLLVSVTSDPLVKVAILFASLILNLDHPGIPNVSGNYSLS